jgi:hypothetical protein
MPHPFLLRLLPLAVVSAVAGTLTAPPADSKTMRGSQ